MLVEEEEGRETWGVMKTAISCWFEMEAHERSDGLPEVA
jgi:hypothetical protein